MSKMTGKLAYVAAQPAAALTGLDFAAAHDAWIHARAEAIRYGQTDDEADCASDAAAVAANRLIAIPVNTPHVIAAKLDAYGWLHADVPDLTNEEWQRGISQSTDYRDADAKALLAIYQAATALPLDRSAWEAASAKLTEAEAVALDMEDSDDASDESVAAANRQLWEAQSEWRDTRAPDLTTLAERAAALIETLAEWNGETTENPAFIARLLAGDQTEAAAAALYQDVIYLLGDRGPVTTAKADTFDPIAWLAEVVAATGSEVVLSEDGLGVSFKGGRAAEACARRDRLTPYHLSRVTALVERRTPPAGPAALPRDPEQERGIGVRIILNSLAGDQRATMAGKLAELGLTPVGWGKGEEAAR